MNGSVWITHCHTEREWWIYNHIFFLLPFCISAASSKANHHANKALAWTYYRQNTSTLSKSSNNDYIGYSRCYEVTLPQLSTNTQWRWHSPSHIWNFHCLLDVSLNFGGIFTTQRCLSLVHLNLPSFIVLSSSTDIILYFIFFIFPYSPLSVCLPADII